MDGSCAAAAVDNPQQKDDRGMAPRAKTRAGQAWENEACRDPEHVTVLDGLGVIALKDV